MNVFKVKILTVIFLSLIFTSCEKVVTNVDLPNTEQQLVVQSFISPQDEVIKVWVSLSKPVFSSTPIEDSDFIENATVVISDGATSKTLSKPFGEYYYWVNNIDFPIVAGKTYTLNVSTPDGKKCDAICTVPLNKIMSFEMVSIDTVDYRNIIKTKFKDISNEDNYYNISATIKYPFSGKTCYAQLGGEYGTGFLIHNTNDGEWINQKFSFQLFGVMKCNFNLIFDFLNTDEHYYNYHKSVYLGYQDNLFTEPIIPYTNINNGLGVFCAYNAFHTEVDYK